MGGAEEVWGHFYSADTDRDLAVTSQEWSSHTNTSSQATRSARMRCSHTSYINPSITNMFILFLLVHMSVLILPNIFFLFFQIFLKIFPNIFFLFFQIFLKSQRTWHQRIYVFYLCKPTGVSGCQLSVHFISPYSNVKWLQSVEITLWEIKV